MLPHLICHAFTFKKEEVMNVSDPFFNIYISRSWRINIDGQIDSIV